MIEIAKMAVIEDPQNALIEEIDSLFRPDVLHALGEGKDWRGAIHAVKKHCEKVIALCDKALSSPASK